MQSTPQAIDTADYIHQDNPIKFGQAWTPEKPKEDLKVSPVKTDSVRSYNVGKSNYAKHKIQPWDIWLEYKLNPWDADIIKRVLRHKEGDSRQLDYEKIIHICQERIRQLNLGLE
jgi:hypothetical protein